MCREIGSVLRIRRVPFNTIAGELWIDVLDEAMSLGAVVGLGVDYHTLMTKDTSYRSVQHLFRVLGRENQSFTLLDDSGGSDPATIQVDSEQLRAAVLPIYDGLWIMNSVDKLNFKYTLPWQE